MAKALEVAHRGGVIHRDIKPENILLTERGEVKVGDFGIAGAVSSSTSALSLGANLGTPRYVSPEQARGERATFKSGLYALGVVFYEGLTGKAPFESETPWGILSKHINEPARAPNSTLQ